MEHLYNSEVAVTRLTVGATDGMPSYAYNVVPGLSSLSCRLDIGFLRQGKDQPMAAEAGRAPDRVGVMYCNSDAAIKPGDRITPVSGPITGTFEIRVIPDGAVDFAEVHHLEVQVVEVAQQLTNSYDFEG